MSESDAQEPQPDDAGKTETAKADSREGSGSAKDATAENTDEVRRVSKRDFLRDVARRSKLPYKTTERFYEAFITELLEHIRLGDDVLLFGFGRFYWQQHGGHTVKFSKNASEVAPYPVMRFSAAREIGAYLKYDDAQAYAEKIPGTRVNRYVGDLPTFADRDGRDKADGDAATDDQLEGTDEDDEP